MSLPPNILAAIAADPTAEGPRRDAADWFEANGQPARAEFIRLQLEVGAVLGPDEAALDTEFQFGYRREAAAADRLDLLPIIAREYELLAAHDKDWVPWEDNRATYRGGFPISLEVPVQEFLARPALTDLAPGGTIHLTEFAAQLPQPPINVKDLLKPGGIQEFTSRKRLADTTPTVKALAASPDLGRIPRLDLSMNEFTGAHIALILGSPHLAELRSLDLGSNTVGPAGAAAVARCAKLTRLESLSFWFGDIGAAGAKELGRSPYLTALTDLELYANNLGDAGVRALAASPTLSRLGRLNIGYNHFSPAAVERLGHSPHLTSLTRLGMSGNATVGDAGLAALARSPLAARLTELDVGCCGLTPAGTRHLDNPAFANLRELEFKAEEDDFPDRVDASALGGSRHLAGLQSLSLAHLDLGDEGAIALADGPGAASLHTLMLEENGITARGIRAIARAEKFRGLRTLHLGKNKLGPDGAAALAESPYLSGLRKLDVEECDLGEEGMLALLRAPWMRTAVSFDFGWNKLTDRFVVELARQPFLANFIELDLGLNRVGDEGIIALANSTYLAGLRRLSLGSNRIGDAGCRALAASPHLDNLKCLILTDNPNTTSRGRVPLWQRFDQPGRCKFVFGFRGRAEDERGAPEPEQPGDGFREDEEEEDV